MYRRNKDDCGPLKTRVLANHRGQLKTVELGHAHVHQHDRYVSLEQNFESLLRGLRFDQVLAKFTEHHLIAEQLGGLIIDHEDIDFLACAHELYYLSVSSRSLKPTLAILLSVKPHTKRREQLLSIHRFRQVFRRSGFKTFFPIPFHRFRG